MARWDEGWTAVLVAMLDAAGAADLARVVTVRGEPHTLARALTRSLAHTAGHVHQLGHAVPALAGGRVADAQHRPRAVGRVSAGRGAARTVGSGTSPPFSDGRPP